MTGTLHKTTICWHILSDDIDSDIFGSKGIPVHKCDNDKLSIDQIGETAEFYILNIEYQIPGYYNSYKNEYHDDTIISLQFARIK